jgi:hypothetical protein
MELVDLLSDDLLSGRFAKNSLAKSFFLLYLHIS